MRFRLFEFEDKTWLPSVVRDGMMDYLRFVLNTGNFYEPVVPLIVELLHHSNQAKIIDLCSGGGGTIEQVHKAIQHAYGSEVSVTLTDIFPNIDAYKFIEKKSDGKINYFPLPVNAAAVPPDLKGSRTIFSAFHHFDPVTATRVINNAVVANEPIAIFDGGDKNIIFIAVTTLLHPVAFILFTPFLRPFKWSRLLFTYLIPLIPLCTIWDGFVSVTRLYTPQQLLQIASSITTTYHWQTGKKRNRFGMRIAYLTGNPL